MGEIRAKKAIDWHIETDKRPGAQKTRWSDVFSKMLDHVDFYHIVYDRQEWTWLREAFAQVESIM